MFISNVVQAMGLRQHPLLFHVRQILLREPQSLAGAVDIMPSKYNSNTHAVSICSHADEIHNLPKYPHTIDLISRNILYIYFPSSVTGHGRAPEDRRHAISGDVDWLRLRELEATELAVLVA
jgi:hypothetical protein